MEELTWGVILAKALFKYSSLESQADVLVLPSRSRAWNGVLLPSVSHDGKWHGTGHRVDDGRDV